MVQASTRPLKNIGGLHALSAAAKLQLGQYEERHHQATRFSECRWSRTLRAEQSDGGIRVEGQPFKPQSQLSRTYRGLHAQGRALLLR
jgi:hypothetical protein